jgi:hypothetical protein
MVQFLLIVFGSSILIIPVFQLPKSSLKFAKPRSVQRGGGMLYLIPFHTESVWVLGSE